MSQLHITDVGICRVDREGRLDQGSDGVMWLPSKRLAVVMDGIGGENGDGSSDISRFEKNLENAQDTPDGIREAFFATCGPPGQSVVVSLWLPSGIDTPSVALLLHAGDCHCFRLRRNGDSPLGMTQLTEGHSLWDTLSIKPTLPPPAAFCQPDETTRSIWSELSHVKAKGDLEYLTEGDKIWSLIKGLEEAYSHNPFFDLLSGTHSDYTTEELRDALFKIIFEYRGFLYCTIGSPPDIVRHVVGSGVGVDVRSGDRFALVSDGIGGEVLTIEEIESILTSEDSASDAARSLVDASKAKNLKIDDRAALVVDVSFRPGEELPHLGGSSSFKLST
jgi:serine/threonine protein phosphatase PrpC